MVFTASKKLEIPGTKLVLEKDGTEIDDDKMLRYELKNHSVLLLLRNGETWMPVEGISAARHLGGLKFYRDSVFYLLLFFFRQLPSELVEWNSTKTGHILGSECDVKMHVRNLGYTLLL